MTKRSAGILMYRRSPELEVLLAHPGGPFWAKKDEGSWSIPKGEYDEAEEPLPCAIREFEEELGARPHGDFIELGEIVQPSRKIVVAFAVEGTFDPHAPVQSVRARMAAEERANAVLPRNRSRRVVCAGLGQGQNSAGTTRLYRPVAGCVTQA
jgi:predicted NUDIX family NTP pyrophosphohydrolase